MEEQLLIMTNIIENIASDFYNYQKSDDRLSKKISDIMLDFNLNV